MVDRAFEARYGNLKHAIRWQRHSRILFSVTYLGPSGSNGKSHINGYGVLTFPTSPSKPPERTVHVRGRERFSRITLVKGRCLEIRFENPQTHVGSWIARLTREMERNPRKRAPCAEW